MRSSVLPPGLLASVALVLGACAAGASLDELPPSAPDAGAPSADAGPPSEACDAGCETESCGPISCAEGERCIDGACIDERCASVRCGAGTTCLHGECIDPGAPPDAGPEEPLPPGPPEPLDAGTPEPDPDAGTFAPPDDTDAGTVTGGGTGGPVAGAPSCLDAGGNTCTTGATTLCEGLPALASSDCAVCCARPVDPPITPASFQIVHRDFYTRWDALDALGQRAPYVHIASQNQPSTVPHERWTQNITTEYGWDEGTVVPFRTAADVASFIHRMLQKGDAGPRYVMIDELRGAADRSTQAIVHDAAVLMRQRYPQWRGRWGAYVVNGMSVGYTGLNDGAKPAIDALLDAGAVIAAEMYAIRREYCAAGTTAAQRDAWLGDFFHGSRGAFPQPRFHWLAQRKVARRSTSQLSILFGVTDGYMTGTGPAIFLDRMFYVWRTRSGYPSVLLPNGGGVGAWKWHDESPTSRDQAFVQSFEHYVAQGRLTSLKGQVPCP
jgi:hypothetical protein